jgi:CRISPR-associated protein Cmr5
MKSRELDRAQHIQECLGRRRTSRLEDYSDRLKGAPAQLMENGLLQMLAFFHSKKDSEYDEIASHLEDWLKRVGLLPGDHDPLKALASLDATAYRRCSEEAIAWLNWAKRLAAAKVAMAGAPGAAS